MDSRTKLRLQGQIRVDGYKVLERAVVEGVDRGWNRAHKHVQRPDALTIREEICQAIMLEIADVLNFDDNTT